MENGEEPADAGVKIKAMINGHSLTSDAETQVDLGIILHGGPRFGCLGVFVEKKEYTEG